MKNNVGKQIKRQQIKDNLISVFNSSIDARVNRYLDIGHQWIIGNHHFAKASSECIDVYRDGYFIAAVMMSQSINESIVVFVADRIKLPKHKSDGNTKSIKELISELEQQKTMSKACAGASRGIYGSYRNDIHHMNPKVGSIGFCSLARENLKRLAIIEREIFGADVIEGKLKPHYPIYWDLNADGTVSTFLRLE